MKATQILLVIIFVISAIIIPQFASADNNVLIATSNSGSGISTGHNDWIIAKDSITTTKIANYLQIEASWYNEAYDIYRVYLDFDLPTNITLVSATLSITPNGAIYNQDGIELVVVDKVSWVFIGSIELASLQARMPSAIVLDAGKITSGSIAIITSNDWYNTAPANWNWLTLDIANYKPTLTYDYVIKADDSIIIIETPISSRMNYVAISCGIIAVIVAFGFLVWKFR